MRFLISFLFSSLLCFGQLNGILDIHAHSDPDSMPRKIDALELVRQAKSEGMRGIVLKNHYAPTVQLAYILRQVVPGIEVYGAIVLNRSVGGVNPAAVEQAAAFKGKYLGIVWMPTLDAENYVRFMKQNRPSIAISKDGRLLPEVIEVLKIVAKENVALGTGHSSAAEDLLLVQEARKLGISKIVVTHPLSAVIGMTMSQIQESVKLGAFIEFCSDTVMPTAREGNRLKIEDFVKTIRVIGADHAILSSDLGQPANPVHTEGWKLYLDMLRKAGISDQEIDLMARRNPARLLGLE
jgi:Family of unknown function (DUF6282)